MFFIDPPMGNIMFHLINGGSMTSVRIESKTLVELLKAVSASSWKSLFSSHLDQEEKEQPVFNQ